MSKETLFNFDNAVKASTLLLGLSGLYFALKSDLRNLATEKTLQNEHLQYQINELKDCCNGKGSRQIVFKQSFGITPKTIELEKEIK